MVNYDQKLLKGFFTTFHIMSEKVVLAFSGGLDTSISVSWLMKKHNLDVIKTADHIIDMGPEGGINGGRIIAEGTPEKVSTIKESYTGKFIREIITNGSMKKTA